MNFPNEFDTQEAGGKLASGCESLRNLLLGLLDSKGRVAEEVHAIRKLGKSLRGGFSLFRLDKTSAVEIQAVGRLLSGPRDAVSRLNTWNKIAWNRDLKVANAIAGLLEQHTHSAARRPPPETIAWCLDRVDAASQGLIEMPTGNLADRVAGGLCKLRRKTLKRCRKLDHRAQEDFHEARKALKAWLGAVGFLPKGIVPEDPHLDRMAELLGDENDLATLSAWLADHGFTAKFAPDLWKSLKAARYKLQRQVIEDSAKLLHSRAD
jgi:hypothetical protein